MTQPIIEEPAPETVTQAQLDEVNARLDARDASDAAAARRARAQRQAHNAVGRQDPLPQIINLTLRHEMTAGAIPAEHHGDTEVKKLIDGTTALSKSVDEDLEWLNEHAKGFNEMVANLRTPGQTSRRLLAVAFIGHFDKFGGSIKRITDRISALDKEAGNLERQEKAHADAARASLRTDMAPHVASEVRQWLRAMPSDTARYSAVAAAVAAGDRELLTALVDKGVPPAILGFNDRKMFDQLIVRAESKFGPEHVARRQAAAVLRARVQSIRAHLQKSSDAVCGIAMLQHDPALAKLIADMRAA